MKKTYRIQQKRTLLVLYINDILFFCIEKIKKGYGQMIKKIKEFLYRSIDSNEISYKKMIELMKNSNFYLIDVRSSQEFEEGHLDGAINIPVYNIEKNIEKIIKNKTDIIILYCSSGYRSKEAKEILENLGFENVYNLKGGLNKIWVK